MYGAKKLFYVEHISYKILETSNTFPEVTIAWEAFVTLWKKHEILRKQT